MTFLTFEKWLETAPEWISAIPEWLQTLFFQFYQTFIYQNRWTFFVNGLKGYVMILQNLLSVKESSELKVGILEIPRALATIFLSLESMLAKDIGFISKIKEKVL